MTRSILLGLVIALSGALLLAGCLPTPAPDDGPSGGGTSGESPSGGGTYGGGDNGGGTVGTGKEFRLADLKVKPSPHLGLAFPGKFTKYYSLMSDVGIGIVRLSVPWAKREPRPGQFSWGELDKAVLAIEELGMESFITLDSDAEWGVQPSQKSARNRPPSDMKAWQRFVSAAVERYDRDGRDDCPGLKKPVRYWQVANEWVSEKNASGGWTGTDDQLIDFINGSYDAVKAADPKATFIMGGIAAINLDVMALASGLADYTAITGANKDKQRSFTPEMGKEAQAQQYAARAFKVVTSTRYDMADLHLYGPVSHYDARIAVMKQKVPQGTPLITSECGGPSLAYGEGVTQEDHFLAAMDINLSALAKGLEFSLWLSLGETAGGQTWGNSKVPLFDTNRKPKGGYWAYKLLALALEDMTSVQQLGEGLFLITSADGSRTGIGWNQAGKRTVNLPAGFKTAQAFRVTDAGSGSVRQETLPQAGGEIVLDGLPLVVSEKKLIPGRG